MAHPCIKSPPVFPGLGCLSLTLSPRRTFFSDPSQSLLLDGAIPASHLSPQAPPPAPVADADRPPVIAALRSIASSAFPATLSLPPPATLCFWRGRACVLFPSPPCQRGPPTHRGLSGMDWPPVGFEGRLAIGVCSPDMDTSAVCFRSSVRHSDPKGSGTQGLPGQSEKPPGKFSSPGRDGTVSLGLATGWACHSTGPCGTGQAASSP